MLVCKPTRNNVSTLPDLITHHMTIKIINSYLYTKPDNDHSFAVFCPGYLEWCLDSTLHLVLFIKFILNSVSVAYICIIQEVVNSSEWWLIHAEWWLFLTSVGRTLALNKQGSEGSIQKLS